MAISYADMYAIDLAREAHEDIHPGDIVRTGPSQFPQWRVIAIDGERVWLRNVSTHADGVTQLDRCRKVEPA